MDQAYFPDKFVVPYSEIVHGDESEFVNISQLSAVTGTPIPQQISELELKPVRFDNLCTKEEMDKVVLKQLI